MHTEHTLDHKTNKSWATKYVHIGTGAPTHLKVFNPEMFLSKGRKRTKKMEQRLKEGKAMQGLPHLGIHPVCRHQTLHCCCGQEALADRNLVWLSLGRSGQQLTNADVNAWSQPSD